MYETLCEKLIAHKTVGIISDMRRSGLKPGGFAYKTAIFDELAQNHTVTHSMWAYQNIAVEVPALTMDHTGLVHAKTLAFAPEYRTDTDDRVRNDAGRLVATELSALALAQGGIETPQVMAFNPLLRLTSSDRAELVFSEAPHLENSVFQLADVIRIASKTLENAFDPPAEGLFYEPLDASLLPEGYYLRGLLAEQAHRRTEKGAINLNRRLSTERRMFEFFDKDIQPFIDGASKPKIVVADTLPLDFEICFDGTSIPADRLERRFNLAIMRHAVSHREEVTTLGWSVPTDEGETGGGRVRYRVSYFLYDGAPAERLSGEKRKVACMGTQAAASKNVFSLLHSPVPDMEGLSPITIGRALGLAVPEADTADSALEVARAKLALAQYGWDAYQDQVHGPILKRRKAWMTELARFYKTAAEAVVSRASEARPLDGSGLTRFGAVRSYRPLRGFSEPDVAPASDGANLLTKNGGGRLL